MKINIVDQNENVLLEEYNFYEAQTAELNRYFLDCIYSDIESLILYAGIH